MTSEQGLRRAWRIPWSALHEPTQWNNAPLMFLPGGLSLLSDLGFGLAGYQEWWKHYTNREIPSTVFVEASGIKA